MQTEHHVPGDPPGSGSLPFREGELETRFHALGEFVPIGIFQSDAAGRYLHANGKWSRITGMDARAALGDGWAGAIHPEDRERVLAAWERSIGSGAEFAAIFRCRRPSGEIRWVSARAAMVRSASGPVGWVGTHEDITDLMRIEEALKESEERFRQIAENIQDVFWMMDVETRRMLYVSPAYEAIWGRSREEVYRSACHWIGTIHPADRRACARKYRKAISRGLRLEVEYRIIRPDGTVRDIHDRGFPVRNPEGRVYRLAGIASDVSEEKHIRNHLAEMARTDSLTRLYNRRYFRDALSKEVLRAHRGGGGFSLAVVDVDHFKRVNDAHGHAVGDHAIRFIADLIRKRVRGSDVVARIGGDEFAVLLPGTPIALAQELVQELLTRMRAFPMSAPGRGRIPLTLSIGLAEWEPSVDEEGLLKMADRALYRAKRLGRNRAVLSTPGGLRTLAAGRRLLQGGA